MKKITIRNRSIRIDTTDLEIYHLLFGVLDSSDKHKIYLKKLRGVSGYTYTDLNGERKDTLRRIEIDHRKGDFFGTLVHELLHAVFPKYSERIICLLEREYLLKSSWKQKRTLLIKFLFRRSKGEENGRF